MIVDPVPGDPMEHWLGVDRPVREPIVLVMRSRWDPRVWGWWLWMRATMPIRRRRQRRNFMRDCSAQIEQWRARL